MRGIVIAGTHSGCGKTTVTLGLLAALKAQGLRVQAFKSGPDFIDTGLHRIITGMPSRNLDLWMCGDEYVQECFRAHASGSDIGVVEGVMGFLDGERSTARLAEVLGLPVLFVIDSFGMAESAGAVLKGFLNSQQKKMIAGVIFNRVASESHFARLKSSITDVPVLGYLPRDNHFDIPHRHLGLMTAEEDPLPAENLDRLAEVVTANIDLRKVLHLSDISHGTGCSPVCQENRQATISGPLSSYQGRAARIAIAYDKAFCFYYEDNLDLLKKAGAELVFFSPLSDRQLPDDIDAIYIGGGYPELYAKQLSDNKPMMHLIKEWADASRTMYAECGGLMFLSQGIHDTEGIFVPMTGVLACETEMKQKRSRLGYREVALLSDCMLGGAGSRLRGHEFHYSDIRQSMQNGPLSMIYKVRNGNGLELQDEGFRYKNTVASYIHLHFGSNPGIARSFVDFAKKERSPYMSWTT